MIDERKKSVYNRPERVGEKVLINLYKGLLDRHTNRLGFCAVWIG